MAKIRSDVKQILLVWAPRLRQKPQAAGEVWAPRLRQKPQAAGEVWAPRLRQKPQAAGEVCWFVSHIR